MKSSSKAENLRSKNETSPCKCSDTLISAIKTILSKLEIVIDAAEEVAINADDVT